MDLLEQMLPLFTRNLVFEAAHMSVSYIYYFFKWSRGQLVDAASWAIH